MILPPIKDLLKGIVKPGSTTIDNFIFILHYKITGLILLVFGMWVTSFQYIGDPIFCVASTMPDDKGFTKMLNTYCWIHSTYSLPSAWNKAVGVDVAHPGIGTVTDKNKHELVYHRYYQWTCFVLFGQAVMFYVPRVIWKSLERCRVRNMVLSLNMPVVEKDLEIKLDMLSEYFVKTLELCSNRSYAFRYFFCEVLNFINVVSQIFIVDAFLGGEFTKYGPEVVRFANMNPEDRLDPMIRVFPRMTKCMFYSYGPSGDVQRLDAMCMLPLNVVNEKIYIFCWFWFVCLSIVSGICLVWRIPLIVSPKLRAGVLVFSQRYANRRILENFVRKGNVGDWMLLYRLGRNVDCVHFKRLVDKIGNRLSNANGLLEEQEARPLYHPYLEK